MILFRVSFKLKIIFFTIVCLMFFGNLVFSNYALNSPKNENPNVIHWHLSSTWPLSFPVFQENILAFANQIDIMSRGRLKIEVSSVAFISPFEIFDAVSKGEVEMGHSVPFYWSSKLPAAQIISAVPFGMTANGINAWFYYGNGLKLWHELYAPYNLVPFPGGNTGVQMGGWFNRQIKSVQDLKGLKMRIGGLGAKIMTKLGAIPQILSVGEINSALRLGKIDAAEWIGPAHDRAMQIYRSAKYYYYPGWHEPGSTTELIINRQAWESLPADLQRMIEISAQALNQIIYAEFEASNIRALRDLQQRYGVEVLPFPKEVIKSLKQAAAIVMEEESQKDAMFKRIYEDYKQFEQDINEWNFNYAYSD